ncbi:glutaredoxin family protein [Aquimarina agarivorans]|uniref:glutaredoxin family protein n=1 Tax=Aquimarina agarivorans TaxID=980584 RepID=UPI000248E8F6|nr:glutaredoxin domain-containing protein [Aquimarina agarivorans]
MNKAIFFIIFIFYSFYGNAQKNGVLIIEEVGKKRTLIFAQNTTDEPRSVFFKVNAIGYRRSGDRPVIKELPPKSKTHLITLIPLANVTSSYTYIFVANKTFENINLKGKNESNADVAQLIKQEIVVFTNNSCPKCERLTELLNSKHITYRTINIDKQERFYKYTWQLLKEKGYHTDTLKLPLASVKGKIIHPIKNLSEFVAKNVE